MSKAVSLIFILLALIFLAAKLQLFYLSVFLMVLIGVIFVILDVVYALEAYQVIFQGKVPYLPSSSKMIKSIIAEISFKDQSIVYDLGCGDAKFLLAVCKKYNVKAIGYEIFLIPFVMAWCNNLFAKKKIILHLASFYQANLADADYVFCYLLPQEITKLVDKLNSELRPGTMVIANSFSLPGWQPVKEISLSQSDKLGNKFYIYQKT